MRPTRVATKTKNAGLPWTPFDPCWICTSLALFVKYLDTESDCWIAARRSGELLSDILEEEVDSDKEEIVLLSELLCEVMEFLSSSVELLEPHLGSVLGPVKNELARMEHEHTNISVSAEFLV